MAGERILIVDTETLIMRSVILIKEGYIVYRAGNLEEAKQQLSLFKPHALLINIDLPADDTTDKTVNGGFDLVAYAKTQTSFTGPVIMIGNRKPSEADKALPGFSDLAGFHKNLGDIANILQTLKKSFGGRANISSHPNMR